MFCVVVVANFGGNQELDILRNGYAPAPAHSLILQAKPKQHYGQDAMQYNLYKAQKQQQQQGTAAAASASVALEVLFAAPCVVACHAWMPQQQ